MPNEISIAIIAVGLLAAVFLSAFLCDCVAMLKLRTSATGNASAARIHDRRATSPKLPQHRGALPGHRRSG